MARPKFDDEKHWLDMGQGKVFFKDLEWQELIPGLLWGTEYHGWHLTISDEGRVDVSNPPKER